MQSSGSRKTWLIVGASRGIGYEFVRQLLNSGQDVLATMRKLPESPQWTDSAEHHGEYPTLFTCDMLDDASIDRFVTGLGNAGILKIDYVVLNAGVLKYPNRATDISYDDFAFHLRTNTIGPIVTAGKLLKLGIPIGTIAFMSSDSGSAEDFRGFEDGFAAYGASKAALNQMLRHMAAELERKQSETVILALHPGEVATDMANVDLGWEVDGQMQPVESVSAMLKVIPSKTIEDSGTFWTWENKQHPW